MWCVVTCHAAADERNTPHTYGQFTNLLDRLSLAVVNWKAVPPVCFRGAAMATGDQYRIRAAEFHAMAQCATSPRLQVHENLAKAYLRLAEQADRNAQTDVIYEPPTPRLDDSDRKR
jgi:hypothetical protein